jgi:hypothetical protein
MPWAPLPRCSWPGCPERAGRCPTHTRLSPRNHRGIPRQARGYDAGHERDRRSMIGLPCELRPAGCTGIATTRDHVIPVSRGGAHGPGRPACKHCSDAQGAMLARGART